MVNERVRQAVINCVPVDPSRVRKELKREGNCFLSGKDLGRVADENRGMLTG